MVVMSLTLTRNERIAIGGGFALAGAGILYLLSRRAAGFTQFASVDYTGDGNPSHVIAVPFTPKYIVIFNKAENAGNGSLWWSGPPFDWAEESRSNTQIPSTDTAKFPFGTNSFDVGKATAASTLANNSSGTAYRLLAYA